MKRLLGILTLLSLIACVATLAVWISTLDVNAMTPQGIAVGPACVRAANGQAELSWSTRGPWMSVWIFPLGNAGPTLSDTCPWHALGFGLDVPGCRGVVPLWFVALATGILPLRWMVRRRRATPAGHCARCGYDLRASPGRCPECGAAAGAAGGES